MKNLSIIFLLAILISCNTSTKNAIEKVSFSIHKIIPTSDIPSHTLDSLKSLNIKIEQSRPDITGYISINDSTLFKPELVVGSFKFLRTINVIIDQANMYYSVIAINPNSTFNNSDINKVKNTGNQVTIYFNLNGAQKWAELTSKNIGTQMAIVVDEKIYSTPVVANQIKNGKLIIAGLPNENIAKKTFRFIKFQHTTISYEQRNETRD